VTQYLALQVGDFVLKRADGFWAYQMAVVVDDADQGVTHVVRGADLLDSTGRQIYLQRMLHLTTPRYMHVPVVSSASGDKLSKQTGAQALDPLRAEPALIAAASFLEISVKQVNSVDDFWRQAIAAWRNRFVEGRPG
jgi:glutamyl-Q tRNA(Asp) synthetase